MKAAGTYAAYLHTEIMRVVPTYLALGSVVLLFALCAVADEVSVDARASMRASVARTTAALAQLLHYPHLWFAVAGELLQRGRADLDVEQPDPVHEAVHDGEREDRGRIFDGYAGGADGRAGS